MKIIITIFFYFSTFASIGEVLFVKGAAKLTRSNKDYKIAKGSMIMLKDQLETSKSSLVVVKLNEGTTIKLEQSSQLSIEEVLASSNQTRIKLNKGSSFFNYLGNKVKGSSSSPLNIETRTASLGVRGTVFYVLITEDSKKNSDTWMCVSKGQVLATSLKNGDNKLVNKGEGIKISKSDPLENPRYLPWTDKLNWNFNGDTQNIETNMETGNVYKDILNMDYD